VSENYIAGRSIPKKKWERNKIMGEERTGSLTPTKVKTAKGKNEGKRRPHSGRSFFPTIRGGGKKTVV